LSLFDTLRPSLLPGLVDAVAHNRRHGRDDVRVRGGDAVFKRRRDATVAIAWTGSAPAPLVGGSREVDFRHPGVVEQLCRALGISADVNAREPFLVRGRLPLFCRRRHG
jgi:phenylalanyl-tRNA synthetase beta subunit